MVRFTVNSTRVAGTAPIILNSWNWDMELRTLKLHLDPSPCTAHISATNSRHRAQRSHNVAPSSHPPCSSLHRWIGNGIIADQASLTYCTPCIMGGYRSRVMSEIALGKSLPPSFCHHLSSSISDPHFAWADEKHRVALEVSVGFRSAHPSTCLF